MKRAWKTWAVMGCAGLLNTGLRAEDNKAQDLQSHLEELEIKLAHTARRTNQPTSTASNVVGLRGSKPEPLSKQLYWKGKEDAASPSPDELKMFRAAVEDARAGRLADAQARLKSFQQVYAQSPLKPDVDATLQLINQALPTLPSQP